LSIPKWNRFEYWQADLARELIISCEHADVPAPAATSEHFSHLLIERPQFLLLTDAFAVRRVAQNRSGRAFGRPQVAQILALEVQQMPDAGGPRIAFGKLNGVLADVETVDRGWQLLQHAATGVVAQRRPQRHVVI